MKAFPSVAAAASILAFSVLTTSCGKNDHKAPAGRSAAEAPVDEAASKAARDDYASRVEAKLKRFHSTALELSRRQAALVEQRISLTSAPEHTGELEALSGQFAQLARQIRDNDIDGDNFAFEFSVLFRAGDIQNWRGYDSVAEADAEKEDSSAKKHATSTAAAAAPGPPIVEAARAHFTAQRGALIQKAEEEVARRTAAYRTGVWELRQKMYPKVTDEQILDLAAKIKSWRDGRRVAVRALEQVQDETDKLRSAWEEKRWQSYVAENTSVEIPPKEERGKEGDSP